MTKCLRWIFLYFSVFITLVVALLFYLHVLDEESSFTFSQILNSNNEEFTPILGKTKLIEETTEYQGSTCSGKTSFTDIISGNRYKYVRDKEIPIIIWWTFFLNEDEIVSCKNENKCYITENRLLQQHHLTRAFLFYGTDFDANDLPLPRKDEHEWGLLHEESPKNNPLFFHNETIVLFNHTSTFRRYSDLPLTTQYLESISILEERPWSTLEQKNDKKHASVVYVQSGCNPPSDRDAYVQELMKHIKVDSYGACLKNKELPDEFKDPLTFEDKGFFKFLAKYKFTLVFENAICDDYITEKIWRPLIIGSVPIYRGSPSIVDWMPNDHSIILVDHFESPKLLADFINKVDRNDSMYEEYLGFKRKGGVTNQRLLDHMTERSWDLADNHFIKNFKCFVCDRIHENIKRQNNGLPSYARVANHRHYGCPRPVLFKLSVPSGTGQFERDYWSRIYDKYVQVAKNMNTAVLSGQTHFNYSLI